MNPIDCSLIDGILDRYATRNNNEYGTEIMRVAFAKALKDARKSRGLTQEDFAGVSSRTYLSTLERGKKSPTLDKLHTLAQTIGIHCLSLMTLTCMYGEKEDDLDALLSRIRKEVESVEQLIGNPRSRTGKRQNDEKNTVGNKPDGVA